MTENIKIIAIGDYACFTRPEFKVERVSYDVPTPSAIEGMLKSIYWKPAIRYCIDKIVVYNPIDFLNVRRNEVQDKVSFKKVKGQMNGKDEDPSIYTSDVRTQRASMILKNVRYGIEFHIEMTGLRSEKPDETLEKHYSMVRRRIEKGQFFRVPCFGCREFPVKNIYLTKEFPPIDSIENMGDVDLGYMLYQMRFKDQGIPLNGNWDSPKFSDEAVAVYYNPHMIDGVIDVSRYKEGAKC